MSLEEHTPKKTKCTCNCFFSSRSAAEETHCPKCHLQTKQTEKEEMPLLSPVTTPKSKVKPTQTQRDFFEEIPVLPLKKQQTDRKRCFNCNKKLGLLGIQCKCGYIFCGGHRLPEKHCCDYDHRKVALERLRLELKKVAKSKIQAI